MSKWILIAGFMYLLMLASQMAYMIVSNALVSHSFEYIKHIDEIERIIKENRILEQKILEASSFKTIERKAKDDLKMIDATDNSYIYL